ncbi:TPA: O-antigen polysaccharide polymerase Wzy family protein [Streptococcus suis]|nr:O-antigen polysaccharide polymerase Wzy [Erysipelotrichia bacterium]
MEKGIFVRIGISVLYLTLIILSFLQGINEVFTAVLVVWTGVVLYCFRDLPKHFTLFSFMITFFTFLLGRDATYLLLGARSFRIITDESASIHAYWSLLVSLLFIFLGYCFTQESSLLKIRKIQAQPSVAYTSAIRNVAKYSFYFTYIFLGIALIYQIKYVISVGYLESYSSLEAGAGTPNFISRLSSFSPFLFFIFLATKPSKKESFLPILLYFVYGLSTLLTGQRFPVIAVVLFLMNYYVFRNREEKWIQKWHITATLISIPLVLSGLFLMDYIRLSKVVESVNFFDSIFNFFAVQGGSINVIKYAYLYRDSLADTPFYSFNSIRSNILNINEFSGNTVQHALYGSSMAHRMSYIIYGEYAYIHGRGSGSSYIAELFHDFGYFGIAIGSMFYGYLIKKISLIKFNHFFKNAFQLAMLSPLFLAPRGTFDSVIGQPFKRSNLFVLFMVFIVAKILSDRGRKI